MESSPLLTHETTKVSAWHEFADLSSMAAQVSIATVTRVALSSIDAVFLGHLGVDELAGSSLALLWTTPVLMAVWASISALTTLCGQAWGARNRRLTGMWFQLGLLMATVLSFPVAAWYWCLGILLPLSTDNVVVVDFAVGFARVLSIAILPSLLFTCIRQYLQTLGVLLPTTVVGLCSIGVAIASNYICIYGIGTWNGIGFLGAPLATVFASCFQLTTLFIYAFLYKKLHHRAWTGWDLRVLTWSRLQTFANLAGPIAGNSFVSNLANALISLVAAKLGARVIAANAVISCLWGLLWALFWGYGCATQIRVANYLGAGTPSMAKRVTKLGFVCTLTVVSLLGVLTACFGHDVIALFTKDEELLKECESVLSIFALAFMLESIEVLMGGVLIGMSKVRTIFWTSAIATWLVNLPIAYIGGVLLGYGFPALWIGILMMELTKTLVYARCLWTADWEDASDQALTAMDLESLETFDDAEKSAVNYITTISESTPRGCVASIPKAVTPPLQRSNTFHSPRSSSITPHRRLSH